MDDGPLENKSEGSRPEGRTISSKEWAALGFLVWFSVLIFKAFEGRGDTDEPRLSLAAEIAPAACLAFAVRFGDWRRPAQASMALSIGGGLLAGIGLSMVTGGDRPLLALLLSGSIQLVIGALVSIAGALYWARKVDGTTAKAIAFALAAVSGTFSLLVTLIYYVAIGMSV